MREFALWVRSIFSNWVSGVSGGGGIVLTLYTTFVDQDLPTKVGFVSLALVCFIVACFVSWRTLYKQIETEEQKENKRRKLNELIQKGNEVIRVNIYESPGVVKNPGEAPQPTQENLSAVDAWIKESERFVTANHPTFIGHFQNSDGMLISIPSGCGGKHFLFGNLYEKIHARLLRLGELLSQI